MVLTERCPSRSRSTTTACGSRPTAVAKAKGADSIDLGTSEDDVAARALYESLGFRNREPGPAGPVMYVYEREL